MRILIIEDEVRLAEALREIMKSQKYTVDVVHDGEDGYDNASTGIYDAIVLDVMLPRMSGLDITRKLRQEGNETPIIMLTARDGVADKIAGLDAGADDYLAKPFIPDELLARIRSISRRQGPVVLNKMEFEDLKLNLSNYTLESPTKNLSLGPKEFEIMRMLISSPNVIVPKEDILVKIWGAEAEVEDNNVEVYISFLRKKIAKLSERVQIATVRRVGYRLEVKG